MLQSQMKCVWKGGEGEYSLGKEVREAEVRKRLLGGLGSVKTVKGGCLGQWGQAKVAGGNLMAKSSLDSCHCLTYPVPLAFVFSTETHTWTNRKCLTGSCFSAK